MPKVMTANLLRTGDVVYLAEGARWVRHLAEAAIAEDAERAQLLEAEAARAVSRQEVVSAYLFDVTITNGSPQPRSVREVIRAAHGPTV